MASRRMQLIPLMPEHAKGAAMTIETDFLTRDTPGPGPHGRRVILNETTRPCISVADWSRAATQTKACLLMSTES
jgi:hypothetical protein